jgi:hypothetical protein
LEGRGLFRSTNALRTARIAADRMNARERLILAAVVTVVTLAAVGATLVYALRFRTARYRANIERELTAFFSLPTEIGAIEPHTLRSRVFRDVRIWLPDRRDLIFDCPQAVWSEWPDGDRDAVELELTGGRLAIGSPQWLPDDYYRVLRAAISRNLPDLSLREVRFNGMDLIWPRADVELTAEGVTGRVRFDPDGQGEATLIAQSLNGHPVTEPIHISAEIVPDADAFLPEVRLKVPSLPVATLKLDQLLDAPIRSGRFSGTITYHCSGEREVVSVTGEATGLELTELAALTPFGPISGTVGLRIDEAVIPDPPYGGLASITFSGRVDGLGFGPLAERAGWPEIRGRAYLNVPQARLEGRSIRQFDATGRIEGVPLEPITQRLGAGVVRGDLSIQVNGLHIRDDALVVLDADVDVRAPAEGGPGAIDRTLLLGALQELIGFELPPQFHDLLPEHVAYRRIGAKVLVSAGRLRLLGLHGSDHNAIMTLDLLGQPIEIPAPARSYPVEPLVRRLRKRLEGVDLDAMRQWWNQPPPAPSRPATRPATAPTSP